jgi:hypothetical protein
LVVIEKKCPPTKIIYKRLEPNDIDTQFSPENNNLLSLYENIFSFNNIGVLGIGKTKLPAPKNNQ